MRAWIYATVLGPTKDRATLSVALMAEKVLLTSASMVSVFARFDFIQLHSLALGQDIERWANMMLKCTSLCASGMIGIEMGSLQSSRQMCSAKTKYSG